MEFIIKNLYSRFERLTLHPITKNGYECIKENIYTQIIKLLFQKYFQRLVVKYEGCKYVNISLVRIIC